MMDISDIFYFYPLFNSKLLKLSTLGSDLINPSFCMDASQRSVGVCIYIREREREREKHTHGNTSCASRV